MNGGKKNVRRFVLFILLGLCTQMCHISERPAFHASSTAFDCSRCKYIVKENDATIDGALLKILPGDYICFPAWANHYTSLLLVNIIGEPSQPVVITNCDGPVLRAVRATEPFNLKFGKSKNFRVTGNSDGESYGFRFIGGTLGLKL